MCALQYWDKSLNSFRTYSEFFLSEQQVTHLDLPLTSDRKKVSVSEKWRIALDYQDDVSVDDDEGDVPKSDIIVTPKSLVSVVRVDSYYNPNLIPKIQANLPNLFFMFIILYSFITYDYIAYTDFSGFLIWKLNEFMFNCFLQV